MVETLDARQSAPAFRLRGVALPAEHGGWSLTLEPVLLGLLVEPSYAGALLGLATLMAFLARTPLKVALVDRRRGRRLPRTEAGERVAALYLAVLGLAVAAAAATASGPFWPPLAAAAPLICIGFAHDIRSRSRHLAAELAGAVGIGSAGAAIVLAGGGGEAPAAGVWLVVAARAVGSIAHVRVQLRRSKRQDHRVGQNDVAQGVAVAAASFGCGAGLVPIAGLAAIAAMAIVHMTLVRRPAAATPFIGMQQIAIGLVIVLVVAGWAS